MLAERIDTFASQRGDCGGAVVDRQRPAVRPTTAPSSVNDPRPVANDTIFEIGSVTKVFTVAAAGGYGGARRGIT